MRARAPRRRVCRRAARAGSSRVRRVVGPPPPFLHRRRRAGSSSYPPGVPCILVTGMSGAGKSTALAELARRGFDVVETDVPPWSEWSDAAGGYVWRDDAVRELLGRERATPLYVSGAVSTRDASTRSSPRSSC